jgi:retron-type reverse transcriptase/5S rRNA maturation endonuclease (ribonuclease M5)
MTQLTVLQSAKNLHDVAALVGFKASALSFILYKKSGASNYKHFEIPKRYGGVREIYAPSSDLKLIQRRLSDILQNCIEEIKEVNGVNDRISHGFKRKKSIITNAKEHRNRKYVFNIDLTNFFGSINFGRVRGFLMKDKNFSLHANVATVLAQIACYNNALPQGSPCSPVISNLIGHVLDIHLVQLASKNGCTYSRYADDLTFSTNKPEFPPSIAKRTAPGEHMWIPGNALTRLVKKSGFAINSLKTRMQYRDSRQEVTGLVVNRKVNVRTEYRRTVRAMVHHLFTKGSFEFVRKVSDGKGVVTLNKTAGITNQLHGMLGFIDGIDLYNKRNSLETKVSKVPSSITRKELMYRRFLLFKEFYAAAMPVIVCEGKTDNVYILHAIRRLTTTFPQLVTTNADGSLKLNVRIYKYSGTSTGRILGINGGTGDISNFMLEYRKEISRFKSLGKQHPVVLLIDNDSGAAPIYNVVQNITGLKPKGSEKFVHVADNLYLVATPWKPGTTQSMMEDFFDATIKATIVDGKKFDSKNDFDTKTHYGKIVFAHKVVRAQAGTIDFSEFKLILSNIVSVIDEHAAKYRVAMPPP